MTRLRAGILGAGRIASGYDDPSAPVVRTLANALRRSDVCELAGFFDVVPARAEAAEHKWGCPATARDRTAWLNHGWDILLIATPAEAHARDLRDCLARKPRAILLEKPVALNPQDGIAMLREAAEASVPVLVDYPRRWNSGVLDVQQDMQAGCFGRVYAIDVAVSGGMRENGVHALDLLYQWWPGQYRIRAVGRVAQTTLLELSNAGSTVAATFTEAPSESCFLWDLTVHCERAQIRIGNRPERLEVLQPAKDPEVPSVVSLQPVKVFDMEREPVLSRSIDMLVAMASDGERARAHVLHEIHEQVFMADVLAAMHTVTA
jgi:predicted dehydrogenase